MTNVSACQRLGLTAIVLLTIATPAAATPAATLLKQLGKYATKEGIQESSEKLVKELGEEGFERLASKLAKEGGEEAFEQTAALAAKHGPDALRALSSGPPPAKLLRALDELPADEVGEAVARLAAGSAGKELAETTARFGVRALKAEAMHPGIGGRFVRALGDDGASLCGKLTQDQAVALGRHIDVIAKAPPTQRRQLIELVEQKSDAFFAWLGSFMEKNPGKAFGSAALLAVFLPNSERILGTDELVQGEDGAWTVVTKPGLAGGAGRVIEEDIVEPASEGVGWLTRGGALVLVSGLAVAIGILLFRIFKS